MVDPSHKLIVDDTDRPRTGRLILDGATISQRPLVPPSPAPGASFGAAQSLDRPLSTSRRISRRPSGLAVQVATNDDAMEVSTPSSPTGDISLQASPVQDVSVRPSGPDSSLLLPVASTLAARRRSSVVSLPSLPLQAPAPSSGLAGFRLPPRTRHDSASSLNSLQQNQSRAPSATPSDEPGSKFTYLNSAASSASNTALNSITMPAPYRNGPVQVLPGIWLGCEENAKDWEGLKRCSIGSILNVAKEIVDLFGTKTSGEPVVGLAPSFLVRSTPDLSKLQMSFGRQGTFHPADPDNGRPELHYLHLPWSHGQSDLVENGFGQAMQFCDEAISRGKGVLIQ